MFIIRRAKLEDADTLLKLARMVYFINLPADRDIITSKILHSRRCFQKAAEGGSTLQSRADTTLESRATVESRATGGIRGIGDGVSESDMFMFALEDTETASVLGTSQIISHMGGPGNPNVSLKLRRREFYSRSLQMGVSHTTVQLHLDESGPTEIGGLILQPSYRRHRDRLGRFLSLARFHFMGLQRGFFADRVIAEMMAPITQDGHNLLWEYLGRRFINLTYSEADRFCQHSREFMTALIPREEIYLTLLPPEARALVGQVGPETMPAKRLLEKLGFAHKDLIDPFDGGPYLQADTDAIPLVRHTRRAPAGEPIDEAKCTHRGFASRLERDGEFRALQGAMAFEPGGAVRLTAPVLEALGAGAGAEIGVTPIETIAAKDPRALDPAEADPTGETGGARRTGAPA